MRPRICCLFGTRPEIIKLAPVVWALRKRSQEVDLRLVSTGQHRDLARPMQDLLEMSPDLDLDLMRPDQELADLGARCLTGVADTLEAERPDLLVVQGDTSSVLFSTLAAYFHRIPVAHVEAGLRTHDPDAPFPEEMMRRLTDAVATWHFSPTRESARNLSREGIPEDRTFVTGNTVVDAARTVREQLPRALSDDVRDWVDRNRPFVVVTLHRRESIPGGLGDAARGMAAAAAARTDVRFIYLAHPNPRVRRVVMPVLQEADNVDVWEPVAYPDMVHLLDRCCLAVTDSGGIQEEAPALDTRVVVARDVTERPEAVRSGWARLAGVDAGRIEDVIHEELDTVIGDTAPAGTPDPFGDGRAGERIADILVSDLCGVSRATSDWTPGAGERGPAAPVPGGDGSPRVR